MGKNYIRDMMFPTDRVVFQELGNLDDVVKTGKDIWLVGSGARLADAARALAAAFGGNTVLCPAVDALLRTSDEYAGAKKEVLLMVADTLRSVSVLSLPQRSSRVVCAARPDLIAKELHGKVSGTEVMLCVPEEHVWAAGLAVSRCLPSFSAKTDLGSPASCSVRFYGRHADTSGPTLEQLNTFADSIRLAQCLVDCPPNLLTTVSFKEYVLQAIEGISEVSHKVIEGEDLRERGYGGLWNVGKTAKCPPCLLILTHAPRGCVAGTKENPTGTALIGKGIVYDTGGAAIKSCEGMCGMKRDMAGAAGVFGAWLSVVKCGGLPSGEPLHCVLCLADNGVGPEMMYNDDILHMYSGLTVEVNNTDCEGRLVLADGAAHIAKHVHCKLIVDMATLTGGQGPATGTHHALFLATSDDLERGVIQAGLTSGEGAHPGLFAPELLMQEFHSVYADMKNKVKDVSNASSSCAGLFIHRHMQHAGHSGDWIHIDMAEPSFKPLGEWATGYGVGILGKLLLA